MPDRRKHHVRHHETRGILLAGTERSQSLRTGSKAHDANCATLRDVPTTLAISHLEFGIWSLEFVVCGLWFVSSPLGARAFAFDVSVFRVWTAACEHLSDAATVSAPAVCPCVPRLCAPAPCAPLPGRCRECDRARARRALPDP